MGLFHYHSHTIASTHAQAQKHDCARLGSVYMNANNVSLPTPSNVAFYKVKCFQMHFNVNFVV